MNDFYIRQIVDAIKKEEETFVHLRQAVVSSVNTTDNTALINIGAGTTGVTAKFVGSTPRVGTTVLVLTEDTDVVVLGEVGTGALTVYTPPGTITMYCSTTAPTGWLLCNGQIITAISHPALFPLILGGVVPDLRDKFIIGAGTTYSQNVSGGNANGHNHGLGTLDDTISDVSVDFASNTTHDHAGRTGFLAEGITTNRAGTNTLGHNHSFVGRVGNNAGIDGDAAGSNLPPYYALTYIIKT